MSRRSCLTAVCILLCACTALHAQTPLPPATNYLIIMTDDQRWDTLWAMPIVQQKLLRRGVRFTQAFVTTPLCCPARASFLSGGFYPHHTGVLDNTLPLGSARQFVDTNTLPLALWRRGYQTALVGKYLNGYHKYLRPAIPPGWSTFLTIGVGGTGAQKSWFNYLFVQGSSGEQPGAGSETAGTQYLTDALRDKALQFLTQAGPAPFFLYFAPFAPHVPATPAPGDEALFPAYRYRDRAYGEANNRDKPLSMQARIARAPLVPGEADTFHQNQLRSLQAVDRAVGAMVDLLQAQGKLEQTVIVYLSDNGYMWGEHGLRGKNVPYEEAVRVPLVMVVPGIAPREEGALVTANLDVPATLLALAGLPVTGDGLSLLPLMQHPQRRLKRPGQVFAEEVFLEGFGQALGYTWAALRTPRYKYIEYAHADNSTLTEFYDLDLDTYEMNNRVQRTEYASVITAMAARVQALRGLIISEQTLPPYSVGTPYSVQLMATGATAPYTWRIIQGQLPAGLALEASGVLSGIPTEARPPEKLTVQVHAASISPQTGQPHSYVKAMMLGTAGPTGPEPGSPGEEDEDED
jgi:arylsulfatase A-like enzyme